MSPSLDHPLDDIDRSIVAALVADGRLSVNGLASEVGAAGRAGNRRSPG